MWGTGQIARANAGLGNYARPPYVKLADVPMPEPRPDEAVVEVSAVSVNRGELASLPNFWDVRMDGSTMSMPMPMGSIPGYELAGRVVE